MRIGRCENGPPSFGEVPPRVLLLVEHTGNENHISPGIIKQEVTRLFDDSRSRPRTLPAQAQMPRTSVTTKLGPCSALYSVGIYQKICYSC